MPSDDHPFRLDVPEPDPPPHLIEQLAEAARHSTPTARRGGRRAATVTVGVVAVFAGVGGAWATGALPVPGLPDGGVPAIVDRSRDDAPSPTGAPSPERTGPATDPSSGPTTGPGASPTAPGRSAQGRPDASPSDRPGGSAPSARPSPSDPPSTTPPTRPSEPPSATPSTPGRGGENPGRGDDRRNQDPGGGDRGQGQGNQGQGNQGQGNQGQGRATGRDVVPGRGRDA